MQGLAGRQWPCVGPCRGPVLWPLAFPSVSLHLNVPFCVPSSPQHGLLSASSRWYQLAYPVGIWALELRKELESVPGSCSGHLLCAGLGLSMCNDMAGLALVVLVMTEDALGAAVRSWEPTGLWLTSPGASKAHGQVVVGREMHGLGVCLFWAQGGHLGFPGPVFIGEFTTGGQDSKAREEEKPATRGQLWSPSKSPGTKEPRAVAVRGCGLCI